MAPKKRAMKDRFWKFVEKTDSCWLWIGTAPSGYGQIRGDAPKSKRLKAHRVSYEMHKGKIPKGYVVCHKCDNPLCVNPEHLFVGTQLDNNRDMVAKGRQRYTGAPAKISDGVVDMIRYGRTLGMTYDKLATLSGISLAHAHRIVNGKRRKGGDAVYVENI